jgi:hypothetical protein
MSMKAGAALLGALALTGCASVVNDVTHPVRIETVTSAGDAVEGANCALDNDKASQNVTTPVVANVRRSHEDLKIACTKTGLQAGNGVATSRANAGLAGNILIGGGIGAVVDHTRGTAYTYPQWVRVVMGQTTYFDRSMDVDGKVNAGMPSPLKGAAPGTQNPTSIACSHQLPGVCPAGQ